MKLTNAKDMKVSDLNHGLPEVGAGVQMLLQNVTVFYSQKTQVDGMTQEVPRPIRTRAAVEPFTPQQLNIRPEGQRGWKWFTLFTLSNLDMKLDDVVRLFGKKYRVMEKYDWHQYDLFRYAVIEDYLDDSIE
jgi:hypothetical protein